MKKLNTEINTWWRAHGLVACAAILALLVAALATVAVLPAASTGSRAPSLSALSLRLAEDFAVTRPVPQSLELDANKVALGERLFHDQRISADDSVSCASCHPLNAGGMDGLRHSVGIRGGVGSINAPTVFNSGLNFSQFWDGRAETLEAQIEGPVNHPLEMASNWAQVLAKLGGDSGYTQDFRRIYPEGLTAANVKDAIAAFERSLVTPDSRFDRYLRGDAEALSTEEKAGYALFQSVGCASCHQGVNLGGNMYEKMGLMGDYFADRGNPTEDDLGRYNQTKNPENMHEFRVPGLRNVALTAPYFHDGSAQSLEQAIEVMVKYQLGRPMAPAEVQNIAAFLRSLTGTYQGQPL